MIDDADEGRGLPEAARILQFSRDVEHDIDEMSQDLLAFDRGEARGALDGASDDGTDTETTALEQDVLAILNEFARASDLESLRGQLPPRSILHSLRKEMHNHSGTAMENYILAAQSDTFGDEIGPDVGPARQQQLNFFESPVFGSTDAIEVVDDLFGSLEGGFGRLMSDPLHGEMNSANLMKNWIQEDEDDSDLGSFIHITAEHGDFKDDYALDGETADRSPRDYAMNTKFSMTPSSKLPASQPALPMMLRQEERPKKKSSMGQLTQQTVTPSTGQATGKDSLNLTPPHGQQPSSPISKLGHPDGIFSPNKDRTQAEAITPARVCEVTVTDVSSPLQPTVVDSSVLGDYCHWTAGPRLSASGIRQLYSGLFATALDEAEAGMAGKMADDQSRTPDDQAASSGISAVAGTAAALLPMLLGGVKSKNSISPMPKIGRETVSTKQPIQDTTQNLRHQANVRSVRVLEIVSRPDIPLKEIMTMCYKASRASTLRCTMSQNCHMILETAPSEATKSQEQYTGKGGWNTIDIQVCISKELRQRVVVLQFFHVDGDVNGKPTGLVRRSPAQYQQFLINIQRLFTTGNISLSGLYKPAVRVTLIQSLDSHFIEQLRNVCREDMWSVLRTQISEMDVQINEAEQLCAILVGLIDPIYRQHGISSDVLEELSKRFSEADPAEITTSSTGDEDIVDHPLEDRKAGMEGCLLLLEYHKRRFQRRYDRELTQRLRKRLASTISVCERLGDYRRAVLRTLADHPLAKTSSLAKAFCAAFDGLEVTSSVESEHLYIKYNAISETESGSNSSGSSQSDIEKDSYVEISGSTSCNDGRERPKLKPSPFPQSITSGDDYDDMFTPQKASRGNTDSESVDKTFLTPPTIAPPAVTPASTGSKIATLTSAAKEGIMNWWYGGSSQQQSNAADDSDNDLVVINHEEERKKKNFSFYVIGHHEVVLYCCACLVSTMPGYVYLTPTMLCLAARIPGISKIHEAYHLADIQEVSVQSNRGTYSAMAFSLAITIFKSGDPLRKELYITPAVVDCSSLKVIIDEARDMLLR